MSSLRFHKGGIAGNSGPQQAHLCPRSSSRRGAQHASQTQEYVVSRRQLGSAHCAVPYCTVLPQLPKNTPTPPKQTSAAHQERHHIDDLRGRGTDAETVSGSTPPGRHNGHHQEAPSLSLSLSLTLSLQIRILPNPILCCGITFSLLLCYPRCHTQRCLA